MQSGPVGSSSTSRLLAKCGISEGGGGEPRTYARLRFVHIGEQLLRGLAQQEGLAIAPPDKRSVAETRQLTESAPLYTFRLIWLTASCIRHTHSNHEVSGAE